MSDYWESLPGLRHTWWSRRRRGFLAVVKQEPKQKRSMSKTAREQFRTEIDAGAPSGGPWPRVRAKIALDLHFATTSQNPPQLERLPKNYLDLLGTGEGLVVDPAPLLYRDDRQVKMLSVSWIDGRRREAGTAEPSIYVEARTRAEALQEMALAAHLMAEAGAREDPDPFGTLWEGERDEGSLETLRWLERGDERSRAAATRLRAHRRYESQRSVLAASDGLLRAVLLGNGLRYIAGVDPLVRLLARSNLRPEFAALVRAEPPTASERAYTLSVPGSVSLPPLPRVPGESEAFRMGLDRAFAAMRQSNPTMYPLVTPARVNVLLVPPRRPRTEDKDLDNLATLIIRSLEAHLGAPPQVPDARSSAGDGNLSGRELISGYQVIELDRLHDDPDEGTVSVFMGDGLNYRSIWAEATHIIEDSFDILDCD